MPVSHAGYEGRYVGDGQRVGHHVDPDDGRGVEGGHLA